LWLGCCDGSVTWLKWIQHDSTTQKWIKSGIFLTNNLNKLPLTPMAMNQSLQTGRDPTFDGRSIELVSGIYKLPAFSHLSWLAWKSSSRSVGKESSMSPPNYDLDLPIWYSKGQHPWHRNNHYITIYHWFLYLWLTGMFWLGMMCNQISPFRLNIDQAKDFAPPLNQSVQGVRISKCRTY
jgi:hypothetical protein